MKEYRLTEVEDAFVRKNKNLNKLSAITSYMKENYAQELSLEEVARIFGYSPTYLSRMFQKYAESHIRAICRISVWNMQ